VRGLEPLVFAFLLGTSVGISCVGQLVVDERTTVFAILGFGLVFIGGAAGGIVLGVTGGRW